MPSLSVLIPCGVFAAVLLWLRYARAENARLARSTEHAELSAHAGTPED